MNARAPLSVSTSACLQATKRASRARAQARTNNGSSRVPCAVKVTTATLARVRCTRAQPISANMVEQNNNDETSQCRTDEPQQVQSHTKIERLEDNTKPEAIALVFGALQSTPSKMSTNHPTTTAATTTSDNNRNKNTIDLTSYDHRQCRPHTTHRDTANCNNLSPASSTSTCMSSSASTTTTIKSQAHSATGSNTNGRSNIVRKRVQANERERERTKSLNEALKILRRRIPAPEAEKRSKIQTLRMAKEYIECLMYLDQKYKSRQQQQQQLHQFHQQHSQSPQSPANSIPIAQFDLSHLRPAVYQNSQEQKAFDGQHKTIGIHITTTSSLPTVHSSQLRNQAPTIIPNHSETRVSSSSSSRPNELEDGSRTPGEPLVRLDSLLSYEFCKFRLKSQATKHVAND